MSKKLAQEVMEIEFLSPSLPESYVARRKALEVKLDPLVKRLWYEGLLNDSAVLQLQYLTYGEQRVVLLKNRTKSGFNSSGITRDGMLKRNQNLIDKLLPLD